jgi:hypothetical protein
VTAPPDSRYGDDVRVHVPRGVDDDGYPRCDVCGGRLNPAASGVYSLVLGWVEGRTGGGAHAVTDRRDLGRWRHKTCHRHGNAQGSLL